MIIGAIAVASLISLVAYRNRTQRQEIGHADTTNPISNVYVDHVAKHQVADIDVSLTQSSDLSTDQSSEQSFSNLTEQSSEQSFNEQPFRNLTTSGSLNTTDSYDDGSSNCSSMGMNLTSDGSMVDDDLDNWDHGTKDIAYATQFFDGEEPTFKRTFSQLTESDDSVTKTATSAPTA